MSQKIKQDEVIQLGNNIRDIRLEKKIKQEEMVAKLQVKGISISRTGYTKIELGRRHIEASCLEAIRDILQTTYERIFEHAR